MAKRYKLLKDLPTVKAGAIFHRCTNETMQVDILKRVNDQGISLSPSFDVPSVHNFNEWFEEVGQLTINDIDWSYKPSIGDTYYYVMSDGDTSSDTYDACLTDDDRILTGNCFKTVEEAEAYQKWLKAVAELRRSSDFKPDWNNAGEEKCHVYYDHSNKQLSASNKFYFQVGAIVYFRTWEEAKQSIKDHKAAWLTYFGVREDK